MNEYFNIYLPKSKREVEIEISMPRYKANISFDTLYFLDGQNTFKDSHATFGRAIRAGKHLKFIASQMKKRILGVAIHNPKTDMGRVNEYSPFKITKTLLDDWKDNDPKICEAFCDDFINVIIPYIETKYNVKRNPENRFIYGSSLAATTAIYLAFKYPNSFNYVGAFSTASFLFENDFISFIKKNINPNINVFLYYGKKEISDSMTKPGLYEKSSKKLYKLFKDNNIRTRLVISASGIHNEETWDEYILDFINFIYSDDIIYKK